MQAGKRKKWGWEAMQGMLRRLCRLAVFACISTTVHAGDIDRQLLKLGPEERAHQACVIRGIDTIRREKHMKADRLKTGITSDAIFTGDRVTTKGGAFRANHHWYGLSFDCKVTKDQMKALSFTYEIGKEIPPKDWEKLGLWR
jgi:hypothetical protein